MKIKINPRNLEPEFASLKNYIESFLDLTSMRGLEIGPFDRPFFSKDQTNVSFVDYRSTAEVKAFADIASGHSSDFVVEVDYVVPTLGDWSLVPPDQFDWILSSHVLEHSGNLVKLLNILASKLRRDGLLISILPDKRCTFDVYRPITTLGTIMQDFLTDADRPRIQSVFDAIFYETPLSISFAMSESLHQRDTLVNNSNFDFALHEAERSMSRYYDAHNYVFTSISYQKIAEQLCKARAIPFLPVVHRPTQEGEMSFVSILKKTDAAPVVAVK